MRKAVEMLTTRLLFVLLLVIVGSATSVAAEPGASSAEIEAYVRSAREAARIPGCAVTVFDTNGIRYSGAFGVADADARPVTDQTPFVIGSLSKALTARATLTLVDQGKLDLQSPANRYVSWLPPQITMRGRDRTAEA